MTEIDYSKKIITIPNILSFFRLLLAFVFLAVYLNARNKAGHSLAIGILVLSALTDVVDGKIARHFHMISNVGKILDPVADKVTQGAVMLALMKHYPFVIVVIAIFLIKECYMGVMGLKVMRDTGWNEGALWYGKLNTVILYGTLMILIFFYQIPNIAANLLLGLCCLSILFCFYKYHIEFRQVLQTKKESSSN